MARKNTQPAPAGAPPRVGVWTAVSSKPQTALISPQEQYERGAAFVEQIGGALVRHYDVPGYTREWVLWSEVEAIPELVAYKELREDLQAGRLDVLWALDMDRLGRDAALCQQVISLCERHHCRVYLSTTPVSLDEPQSSGMKYLYALQAVRAEEEIDRLRDKLQVGMKGRVLRGLFPNRPPAGYSPIRSAATGRVTGYEFNAYIAGVDEITRLFLEGLPFLEILRRLQELDLPTPAGKGWHYSNVRNIVMSDVYAGRPFWGEYTYQSEEPSARYPARWDEATYQAILRERERRARSSYIRRGAGPYTGVARCRRCGFPMSRFTQRQYGRANTYLRCSVHGTRNQVDRQLVSCPIYNNIAEWRVTAAVMDRLEELRDPVVLDAVCARMADTHDARSQLLADLERARSASQELVDRRTRLALDRSAGTMDVTVYQAADAALRSELERLQGEISHLEHGLATLPDAARRRADLAQLAADFPSLIEYAEPARIAAALQRAGITIWVEEGDIDVEP